MGRVILSVADVLVHRFLVDGCPAVRVREPLRGIRIVDARFDARLGLVQLELEGPDFKGSPPVGLGVAETVNPVLEREPVLDPDVLVETVADLIRNAGCFCNCWREVAVLGKVGVTTPYTCAVCRSKAALERIPAWVREKAEARIRQENEPPVTGPGEVAP